MRALKSTDTGLIDLKALGAIGSEIEASPANTHIISLSATSPITAQSCDLTLLNKAVGELRKRLSPSKTLIFVLDASEHCVYAIPDIRELSEVDFLLLQPNRVKKYIIYFH
jgi:hypothetical protein